MKNTLLQSISFGVVFVLIESVTYSDPNNTSQNNNSYRTQFASTQKGLTATGASGCSSTNCHGGATPGVGEVFVVNGTTITVTSPVAVPPLNTATVADTGPDVSLDLDPGHYFLGAIIPIIQLIFNKI